MDAVLAFPGTLAEKIAGGVLHGLIDVPFSPSVWNRGELLPLRALDGAVRLARPGRTPLAADLLQRHQGEVRQRLDRTGLPLDHLLEGDVLRVGRGHFTSWPLDTAPGAGAYSLPTRRAQGAATTGPDGGQVPAHARL